MSPRRKMLVLGVVFMLLTAGCELEASLAPIDIVAKDYAFEGVPSTIRGGTVTVNFTNEGRAEHELAFLDIGDASFDRFRKEFPKVLQGGPFPSFMRRGAVPIEIEPGKSVRTTFTLPAGRYTLVCALNDEPGPAPEGDQEEGPQGPPHYELGMRQQVTVEGEGGELTVPEGKIVAKDYTFEISGVRAGKNQVAFRNEGPAQWHFAAVLEFPAGVDEREAMSAFEASIQAEQSGKPPPPGTPEPKDVGFSGIYSPGLGGTFELTLKSGRTYIVVCFIQDLTGGPPHAIGHKMVRTFTVE